MKKTRGIVRLSKLVPLSQGDGLIAMNQWHPYIAQNGVYGDRSSGQVIRR
jgi:hypothetical protein